MMSHYNEVIAAFDKNPLFHNHIELKLIFLKKNKKCRIDHVIKKI
jgi:hypothetical protein